MYKAFYADIKITATRGKFFPVDTSRLNAIKHIDGVQNVTTEIEDNVFAVNNDQQKVITLIGIENDYFKVNDLAQYIFDGDTVVSIGHPYTAIAGADIMNELGLDINTLSTLTVNYPNPEITNQDLDPTSAIGSLDLHPAGVFKVGDEFDGRYVLAPLPLVQALFHQKGRCSSIEIKADPGTVTDIQKQLQTMLGSAFRVETRYEQNKTLYMAMGTEKLAIYAILVLVLLIASFNMVGALSMLVLQKQKDIAILRAMGALPATIRTIFLLEGVLWSLIGGLSGILTGCIICLLQQKFGIVKLSGSSFVVDAFPVAIQWQDILRVIATITAVGLLISWYPAMRATRVVDPSLKST